MSGQYLVNLWGRLATAPLSGWKVPYDGPVDPGISHCGWQDSDIWRIQGKMGTAWAQHLLGHKFWSFQIELLANWGHELCEETSEVGIIVHFSSHLVSEPNKFLLGGGGFNQSVQFGSVKRSAMLAGRHLPTRSDWKLRCRVVWAVWCIFNSDMISSETRWDRYICTPAHTHTTNMDYILDLIIYIYICGHCVSDICNMHMHFSVDF